MFTDSVLCYIKNCIETVTVDKCIRIYPNQKPWMNKKVRQLLKERNNAFKSGDTAIYSTARANLKRGIREAKSMYRRKIEDHLDSHNSRQVWQGVQHLTNYKTNVGVADGDASLAEKLNYFFARLEVDQPGAPILTPGAYEAWTVEEWQVRCILRSINTRKAAGPDGISGRVLKDCADQLAGVLTRIFNQSLSQVTVPLCLKSSIVVPLPKKLHINSFSDYRPVALTSVVMKCFEKLVQSHIISFLPPNFDTHQFAYRANSFTEDAILTALQAALCHLEHPGSYVRLLFVDYSSAFNTILPHKLMDKLVDLGICLWIKSFLRDRSQRVRVGPYTSTAISLSTGSPQGCVLSPLLYTLYTYDCTPVQHSNTLVKSADDTTTVGLIFGGGDESAYRYVVERLTPWCGENNLYIIYTTQHL